jgi:hypothetical protein
VVKGKETYDVLYKGMYNQGDKEEKEGGVESRNDRYRGGREDAVVAHIGVSIGQSVLGA